MDKRNVFTMIFLCFLVTTSLCKEEPNHLFAESSSEVIGFKNPSATPADVPLRSQQHKFPVQVSTITDSSSSDVEGIDSLDGRVLWASKNAKKSIKWTTHHKIRNVPTMRKLKFAMRRSTRRHNVLKSLHDTGMPSSASVLKNSPDKEAFTFQKAPTSSITGLAYKTEITAPFKLTILPTGETNTPPVETADAKSDWVFIEDNTTKQDDEKSSHSYDTEDNSSPRSEPKVNGHEGSAGHTGTATSQHKMAVHPGVKASSGPRWKAAYDHAQLDDNKKGKHFKAKKKKSRSEDEEPVDSRSPAATVGGILAAILMVLFIFTGVPRLWRICKKQWRRRYKRKIGINFPSTGYFSEELSEEEIIFDRTTTRRNKGASPVATPRTSPRRSQTVSSSQSPDHPTQQQKVWTLTNTPRSTPLMAVPTLDDTPRTEVWTVNETPEAKSLDSSFTTSSLSDLLAETPRSVSLTSVSSISLVSETEVGDSDHRAIENRSSVPALDLTDETVSSSPSFSTQPRLGSSTSSEQTTLEPSPSPHPSKPGLSLLPAASDELLPSVSMARDGTSFSTESCKTPVAARNEVVIAMDDDDEEIDNSRDKSASEVLSTVKDAYKESSKEEVVIRMGLDDDDNKKSSVISKSESECLGPSTSSKRATLEPLLSPRRSKLSLSLLPTASNESTPSVSMTSGSTSSSTESCKTPVAARNEVTIAMDDDDEEIDNSRGKSKSEVLSVVKDADKESSKEEVVISMALEDDDNKESSVICESESECLGPSTSAKQIILEPSISPRPSKPSLSLLPTAFDESTPSVSMGSNGTSSSTESCKTPVAARNEVVITMDDNDEEIDNSRVKSESEVLNVVKDAEKESSKEEVVIRMGLDNDEESSVITESESESSSGEMIYTSQESKMKTVTTGDAIIDIMESENDNEEFETSANNEKSNQDETPLLTPPTIPPPTASTELPQGKSLIGGRKALENRRFIKYLVKERDSTGFRSDLNAAVSRILGEQKNLVDKNKVKRLVIKHQTQETKYSLAESISRAKSMIMDENVDKERDKRSSMSRKLIQRTVKYPGRPKQTLAEEIAFAKDIVLLRHARPKDAAVSKAKREVPREDVSMTSLDRGASTSNSAKIRVLNHKDYKTWKELQKDIKMKKAQGIKPSDVLQGLQTIRDIYNLPRIPVDSEGGCLCYYCEKHIKRAQRKKFFKLPSKMFSFKSKSSSTKESHSVSQSSSFTSPAAAGPSTSSAAKL